MEAAAKTDKLVLLVAQRNGDMQDPAARRPAPRRRRRPRSCRSSRLPNGTTRVLVEGIARARVTRYVAGGPYLRATIAPELDWNRSGRSSDDPRARRSRPVAVRGIRGAPPAHPARSRRARAGTESEERQACGVAAHIARSSSTSRQTLLEAPTLNDLLEALSRMIAAEIELLRLERKIDDDVRGSLFQNQREFYLQEQLKAIHRELGQEDGDDFGDLEQRSTKKATARTGEGARAAASCASCAACRRSHPRPRSSRNFVDWILALPWTERTDDVLDVAHARRDSRRGPLRARGSEGSHPRLHRRAVARRARSKGRSSASSARRASARRRSAAPSRAHSAASSCACR